MEAVILAAGIGKRLRPITADRPKCLLEIDGKTLLERQVDQLRQNGIRHIGIVVGYMAMRVMDRVRPGDGISYIYNPHYATSNNVVSMRMALDRVTDRFVYLMGDCIFEDDLLSRLIAQDSSNTVAVDFSARHSDNEVMVSLCGDKVVRIGKGIGDDPGQGRFAGAVKLGRDIAHIMRSEIDRLIAAGRSDLYTCDVLDTMIRRRALAVSFIDVTDLFWDEIDNVKDWERVREAFVQERSALSVPNRR
jgi:choline kinase